MWRHAPGEGAGPADGPMTVGATQGGWLWSWKDGIDRAWMGCYGADLPFGEAAKSMAAPDQDDAVARTAGPEALEAVAAAAMRCGGCGAKVAAVLPCDMC